MNNFDDILNSSPAAEQGNRQDYAARKQSEREALFALSDNTALEVASDGGMFQIYLDVQSRFDRYSAVNALLIMAQNPEATRVGSFDFWKERGGYIKSGAVGISILEPHNYTKEDGSAGTGYNIKKVFDISQVDTRGMKPTMPPPIYTDRQLLQALVSKSPVKITGVDKLPGNLCAATNPQTGEISVCRGMEFADIFRSVAKELAIAEIGRGSDKAPCNPEFSAYSAAYMLCRQHGVDTQGFGFSDAPDVLGRLEAQAVKGELSQIRDLTGNISGRMAKQLELISKAAKNQSVR